MINAFKNSLLTLIILVALLMLNKLAEGGKDGIIIMFVLSISYGAFKIWDEHTDES